MLELDLGLANMPILGEGLRWRRESEHGIFFNMRNAAAGDAFDTGCLTRVVDIPNAHDTHYHIVRVEPYTSLFSPAASSASSAPRAGSGGVSIVHHMDLFICGDAMRHAPTDETCLMQTWLDGAGPCYAMVWAYDKGALAPYDLPPDAGFRVGKGTPFTKLMLQIHYLLPRRPVEGAGGG